MKALTLQALVIALVLLIFLFVSAGAQPLSDGCQWGTSYDPACDVNHDG
jgi:hypothetical protein